MLVTLAIAGENLRAQWGIIDDHDVMRLLGPDGNASLREFPHLLLSTGYVGLKGDIRCVPTCYGLKVLQTIFWGANAHAWYLTQMALFAVAIAFFWRSLQMWIGLLSGAGVVLFCLTYPFWADILARLGPGEIYAAPGIAMFVYATARIVSLSLRNDARPSAPLMAGYWLLLLAGALLAIGSKESFVLLLIPAGLTAAVLLWKRRLTLAGGITLALVAVFGLCVVAGTMNVLGGKADIYGNKVGLGRQVSLLFEGVGKVFAKADVWDAAALAALILLLAVRRRQMREFVRPLAQAGIVLAGLLFLYVSQYSFYSGSWPTASTRYDFPGVLAWPLYWVTLGVLFRNLLRRALPSPWPRRFLHAGVLVLLAALISSRGYGALAERTKQNAEYTRFFTGRIEQMAALLRNEPARPLLLVSHFVGDYEPVTSVPLFLQARGVTNAIYLKLDWRPMGRPFSEHEKLLAPTMEAWSKNGKDAIRPLAGLPADARPFALGFSGDPTGPYLSLGRIW